MEQRRPDICDPLGARTGAVGRLLNEPQNEKGSGGRQRNSEQAYKINLPAVRAAPAKVRRQENQRCGPEGELRQSAPQIRRVH